MFNFCYNILNRDCRSHTCQPYGGAIWRTLLKIKYVSLATRAKTFDQIDACRAACLALSPEALRPTRVCVL